MSTRQRSIAASLATLSVFSLAMLPVAAQGADAPSCLKASINDNRLSDIVTVKNTCKTSYSVKVIWAHELDSSCTYLVPGQSFQTERNYPGRFDGLTLC